MNGRIINNTQMENLIKPVFALLAVPGTLTVLEPDGEVKFYATFPIGRNQLDIMALDRGNIWSMQKWDGRSNAGNIIDYDKGQIYHWNYIDGCSTCGDLLQPEE
jgi:hypothetical protein